LSRRGDGSRRGRPPPTPLHHRRARDARGSAHADTARPAPPGSAGVTNHSGVAAVGTSPAPVRPAILGASSTARLRATSSAPDPGGIPPRFTGTIRPRSFDRPPRRAHRSLPEPAPSLATNEGDFLSGAEGNKFLAHEGNKTGACGVYRGPASMPLPAPYRRSCGSAFFLARWALSAVALIDTCNSLGAPGFSETGRYRGAGRLRHTSNLGPSASRMDAPLEAGTYGRPEGHDRIEDEHGREQPATRHAP
jgi:hypothetical protein